MPAKSKWNAVANGRIGGKRRIALLTQEERKELARKAAIARWTKAKNAPTTDSDPVR